MLSSAVVVSFAASAAAQIVNNGNPAIPFMAETNSLGVVTGQPLPVTTIATSQPLPVTTQPGAVLSQPSAATAPAGANSYYSASTNLVAGPSVAVVAPAVIAPLGTGVAPPPAMGTGTGSGSGSNGTFTMGSASPMGGSAAGTSTTTGEGSSATGTSSSSSSKSSSAAGLVAEPAMGLGLLGLVAAGLL